MARDPFALPPVSPSTNRAIKEAYLFLCERDRRRSDARDILKGLVAYHGAKVTFPSYRTALRCGGIYTEAATSSDLTTAILLLNSFAAKAERYLREAGDTDEAHFDFANARIEEARCQGYLFGRGAA